MPAHADYLCSRCHEVGKMAAPVELPVGSKRCPFCGKAKWLERIWGGYTPLISTQAGRNAIKANEMLGPAGYDHQRTAKMNAWRNTRRSPLMGPRIVGMHQLAPTVAAMTGGQIPNLAMGSPGESKPAERVFSHPGVAMPRTLMLDAGTEYAVPKG